MRGRLVRKFVPVTQEMKKVKLGRAYRLVRHHLREEGKRRLKWMDWYKAHGENASLTCRYFGISRKTFHKWYKRHRMVGLRGLDDVSRAPIHRRQPEMSREEELRVVGLRKQHICYGKEKLRVLYQQEYGQDISAWKIYRVIRKHDLYAHPVRNAVLREKHKRAAKKLRITALKNQPITGMLVQLDTKAIWCQPHKRYIFTAVERETRIAFARMYKNPSSASARDFLLRLYFLLDKRVAYVHSDNGSEFLKHFETVCAELHIPHYFSRVRTPTDHPQIERFNRTIEDEFLQMGHYIDDPVLFNRLVTDWLVEYNFHRPHQALGYMTPMAWLFQKQKVLPMYPTSTTS